MNKIFLLAGLSALSLCAACGNGGGPAVRPPGNFSNASLSGQYVYQVNGVELSSTSSFLLKESGVFTADGNGHITGGTDDYQGAFAYSSGSVTGSYLIANDGTGQINISSSDGGILDLNVTMASSNKVYLQVAQTTTLISPIIAANGSGVAEKQSSPAISAAPNGTFVFLQHKFNSGNSTAISQAGVFTSTNGVLTGTSDLNLNGALGTATISGTLSAPDSDGRGAGTIQNSTGTSTNFAYYVVDSNNFRFFSTDNGILGQGRAEMQPTSALTNASLIGGYAFGSRGDDFNTSAGGINGVNTVGAFTADGAGAITAGTYDSVKDGNTSTEIPFTGTYEVDGSTGRTQVTLAPNGGGIIQQIFWLVSPGRAFLLTDDASKIEDGTIDAQQPSSFSSSSLQGQFAFFTNGYDLNSGFFVDRVGTLQWDGSSKLTLSEFVNDSGGGNTATLNGSYSVASGGRVAASVNNLSNNLVFYLTSATDGYVLQNDPGVEITGHMTAQP